MGSSRSVKPLTLGTEPAGFIPDSQFVPDSGGATGFIPDSQFISDEDRFGGVSGAVKAGALGFLRGATLGASDVGLVKSNLVSPETIGGLQELQPEASIAGEIGSFLLPSGPAALIGKTGKAVAGGIKGLRAAKEAADATKVAKVLGAFDDVGASVVGGAVEGSLYAGIGSTLNEYALGDPSLNAEKIVSNFGHGALLGGILGGALKGAEIGIPEGLRAAKDSLVSLRNKLIGTGEESGGLLAKSLEGVSPKLSEAIRNRTTRLDVDEGIKLINETTSELNTAHKNLQTELKRLNSEIRPKEVEALIKSADPKVVMAEGQNTINFLKTTIDQMRAEPALFAPAASRKLELFASDFAKKVTDNITPENIFNEMRALKQNIQNKIVFSKTPSIQEIESIAVIDGVQKKINQALHNPQIFGDAGARLAQHDSLLTKLYQFVPSKDKKKAGTEFQKAFMSKIGSGPSTRWEFDSKKVELAFKRAETLGGEKKLRLLDEYHDLLNAIPDHIETTYKNVPNTRFDKEQLRHILDNSKKTSAESAKKYIESAKNAKSGLGMGDYAAGAIAFVNPYVAGAIKAYNIGRNPIHAMNQLAEVERLVGKASGALGKGAKAIFKPSVRAIQKSTLPFIRNSTEEKKVYKEITDKVAHLNGDPNTFSDELSKSTDFLKDIAPDTAEALQMASVRAIQFLASKIPGNKELDPFGEPYEPSKEEMSQFFRYYDITEKPVLALEQVADGTLTPETIEALTVVHPKLYDYMKGLVMTEATEAIAKDKAIPYQTRQMVSMFIGEPLQQAFTPQAIQANQMTFVQPNQQHAQDQMMGTKPSKTGMGKITLAKRSELDRGRMES